MVTKLTRWGDESISLASIDEEWDTQSLHSAANNPIGLEPSGQVAAASRHHHRRRMEIEGDLMDIQSAISSEERSRWMPRSKLLISMALTIFMALSTVRVRSESRMASSASPTSSAHIKDDDHSILTSKRLSQSYQKAGFATTASLDSVGISKSLQHLTNLGDGPFNATSDVPFFFHVPRSSGSTVKDVLGGCYGMVEATDVGARKQQKLRVNAADDALKIVHADDNAAYVNVDTSTAEGIYRAKQLGLVESRLADVIISQHLHPAATLFNEEQQGSCFAMVRHPIERAVSLFHYLAVANWEPTYDPSLAYVSIEMYARSKRAEHNWMTRFLSNELERELNEKHLAIAKKVLRKKCLVGLMEHKDESFTRFEKYFGWSAKDRDQMECRERLLHWGWSNKHSHPQVEEGTVVWDVLYRKNEYDMQLYEYARELFDQQSILFGGDGSSRYQADVNEEQNAARDVRI